MIDYRRCDAFWNLDETERPLIAGWVGSYQAPELYPCGMAELAEGELLPADLVFDAFVPDYEALYVAHKDLGTDVPWAAFPVMVVPWLEAIAGCPIYHHQGHVWAGPIADAYEQLGRQRPMIREMWLDKLLEFTCRLVDLAAGRFPVALSLMRGPADLLAAVRGAEQSIYDLIDRPGDAGRLLALFTDLWIAVANAQRVKLPAFCGGYSLSIQSLWCRKFGGWFQDDAVAFWSPDLYRKHLRQHEARLAQCMPVTGIHLHSAALFTVDDLVQMPGLDVIEINLDDVGLRIPEMIPCFQRVLKRKRLLVWGAFTESDLIAMHNALPARGLALQLIGVTRQRVRDVAVWVKEIWGDR